MPQLVVCVRGPAPWGFRLVGGKDFEQPLSISRITPGSKAEVAGLCVGDIILTIDGVQTEGMTHLQAQNTIKACGDEMALLINRSESRIWSPLTKEEGKQHPYKMNLASDPERPRYTQGTSWSAPCPPSVPGPGLRSSFSSPGSYKAAFAAVYPAAIGLARRHSTSSIPSRLRAEPQQLKHMARFCRQGQMEVDVPGLRVLHKQFNSPLQLYSQQNILDSLQGQISSLSPMHTSVEPVFPTPVPITHTDSEVYKMLQENQECDEPPRQSASFRVLQQILESEGNGELEKPSGFRSVKAPASRVASSIGSGQTLPMCELCGTAIVGLMVKVREQFRHPECYTCTQCSINLKQKGHFFVADQIFCETHAKERLPPPEGYDVVTVFPES
ncbi:PDZ and LIM domain protein 1 isoform X2 [Callorhinchus milii]|uniref:PDZ and LIM domain protein 1 isoform X2 n=1 Tax=Callorhinchus milii TaxID=7868 RepID=UPI001C3FC207|nr:PDZ and LIM domain protein 1 isoform X2 [Callorhinchus milii]